MRTKARPRYNRSDALALIRETIFHLQAIEARSHERRMLILDLEAFLPTPAFGRGNPKQEDPLP